MFTGIIRATTDVAGHKKKDNGMVVVFQKPEDWEIGLGDSIATNGVCLTVKEINDSVYVAELMPETLAKTSFGQVLPQRVNLELPLRADQLLDGHMVQGHVDTAGVVVDRADRDAAVIFTIRLNSPEMSLVVQKGSITVDGISLTVVDVTEDMFTVSLVSYTLANTTASDWQKGTVVNIEYDIMGKYIINYLKQIEK